MFLNGAFKWLESDCRILVANVHTETIKFLACNVTEILISFDEV